MYGRCTRQRGPCLRFRKSLYPCVLIGQSGRPGNAAFILNRRATAAFTDTVTHRKFRKFSALPFSPSEESKDETVLYRLRRLFAALFALSCGQQAFKRDAQPAEPPVALFSYTLSASGQSQRHGA